ncbi:MFS transporter [Sodalis sp. RH24]|uniref:MFS transporter n=1 Tax=unclassified Sodalis (in: enterobacteria) TaxID=2636512 RepID=UPI0039B3FCBD
MNNLTWLVSVASLTFFMQSLDTTMLYLAIPSMAQALHQSSLSMGMVVVSYMLTVMVFTPVCGWLADTYGYRRIYLLALGLFSLGSFLCAAADTLTAIILARFLQGIGGALMLPVTRVVILKTTLPADKLSALNKITLLGLGGTLLGPPLSGLLITTCSWRMIFLVNIPLCLICVVLAKKYMPEQLTSSMRGKFDTIGFMLVVPALLLILLGLLGIGKHYFTGMWVIIFFLIAMLLLYRYKNHQDNTNDPLFTLSLFRHRTFAVGIASNICVRIFIASVPLVLSLMLQREFNYSPRGVSIIMLSLASGSISARFLLRPALIWCGYRCLLLIATTVSAALIYSLTLPGLNGSLDSVVILIFILGVFTSVLYATMNTLTFSELTDETYHAGNSLLILSQLLSIIISVTLTFTVLHYVNYAANARGLENYHVSFLLMSFGLFLCCFIFLRLDKNDGDVFVQETQK